MVIFSTSTARNLYGTRIYTGTQASCGLTAFTCAMKRALNAQKIEEDYVLIERVKVSLFGTKYPYLR